MTLTLYHDAKIPVSFRIEPELVAAIDSAAERSSGTRSDVIRSALLRFLPDCFDAVPQDDFRFREETLKCLSTRTINCLLRKGYRTTEQLLHAKEQDLLNVKNFGPSSLYEVRCWQREVTAIELKNAYST